MKATTIEEVLLILRKIIEECKTTNNPMGYFSVLYCNVTENVRLGILQKRFEDNARMERLDVIFANRFIEAYENYSLQKSITQSWKIVFDSAQKDYMVLQYLLQGINTHINLDLGIAAVQALEQGNLEGLKKDFYAINQLLSDMTAEVKLKMGVISPVFGFLMPIAKNWDDKVIQFSIEKARDGAWEFATVLQQNPSRFETLVFERDKVIQKLGFALVNPKRSLQWILNAIRFFEKGTVKDKIEILEQHLSKTKKLL